MCFSNWVFHFSCHVCVFLRCIKTLVNTSAALLTTQDNSRFYSKETHSTSVFKLVVLFPTVAYLPIVGVSIAIICGYTVSYMAHLTFHLTALPLLTITISIQTCLVSKFKLGVKSVRYDPATSLSLFSVTRGKVSPTLTTKAQSHI